MRSWWVRLAAAAGTGCAGEPGTTPDETGAETDAAWATAFDTTGFGALSGVWGSGPDDVWMVGGHPDAAEIHHFDGSAWSSVDAPALGLLVWVYGFGPDDAIAVGVGGGIARWDGASWTTVESGTDEDLWGVWGASPDDLWVVGGDPDDGDPMILHYDGSAFTPVALPAAANDRGAHALFKVWGIGGRVWSVGQKGLLVEWDGAQWVQQATGASDDIVALWGTAPDHVLAVGGRATGQLSRYDGTTWTTTTSPRLPGLSAVTMATPDEAVIGGVGGWVGHVDPGPEGGEPVAETPVDTVDVHAVWSDGAGTWFGVAGHFYEPYYGSALLRTESAP
ncbi:MAG: hypothetical protein ABMB14_06200 [Myxococcota bacterium]